MKVDLVIPTSLNEITVGQYQDFLNVYENNEESEFVTQKMISIFCGVKLNYVAMMKLTDVNDIVASINKMFEHKQKHELRFELGGTTFGFIPNLEEITLGEYTDLEANLSNWSTMHKAMAVMYRPIVKDVKGKYEIEQYNGTITYAEVMKFAPLNVAMGAMLFFWTLSNELLQFTLHYLAEEVEKMNIAENPNLGESGDGLTASINLLKEASSNLKELQDFHFTSALLG